MDNYLIRYNRCYSLTDWQDDCELIGDIGLGLLRSTYGKVVSVTVIDVTVINGRHVFQDRLHSNSIRIKDIIFAILFLPFTIVFAGLGCVAYACSRSRKYIKLCHEASINNASEPNTALFPDITM